MSVRKVVRLHLLGNIKKVPTFATQIGLMAETVL